MKKLNGSDLKFSLYAAFLWLVYLLAAMSPFMPTPPLSAQNRDFAYTYEATTLPRDILQYRQWATWTWDKNKLDAVYDRVDFRHQLSYGVTHNWELGFYLSDWYYERGPSLSHDQTKWSNVALESIWSLSDPFLDPFGSALSGQVKLGEELLALEGKLVLQKNIGDFVLVYNAAIEAQWRSSADETDIGIVQQSAGLNYEPFQMLAFGVELLSHITFENWNEHEEPTFYVGPVAALRERGWWVTVAPLFQTTGVGGAVNYNFRILVGVNLN